MSCPLLKVHHLTWHDAEAVAMLGMRESGQYLVRPDGYIAYRCAGTDLRGLEQYLAR
jgi:hypothetical protein